MELLVWQGFYVTPARWRAIARMMANTLQFHIRLAAATHARLENERSSVLRIAGARRLIHAFPRRGHEKPRQIPPDKCRTTGLPGRHAERPQVPACRVVNID